MHLDTIKLEAMHQELEKRSFDVSEALKRLVSRKGRTPIHIATLVKKSYRDSGGAGRVEVENPYDTQPPRTVPSSSDVPTKDGGPSEPIRSDARGNTLLLSGTGRFLSGSRDGGTGMGRQS